MKANSDFRPPEHIFDDGDAVENYIEWRDAEIERRLNEPADEYYPWSPENYAEAVREYVAIDQAICLAVREKHHNVDRLMFDAVHSYWMLMLLKKYDERSGVMDGQ